MSAAKRSVWEQKASREKDVVHRVAALAVGADGECRGRVYGKVTFMFKGAEIFMVTTSTNGEGAPEVAFDSAGDLWDAIVKWCRKTEQGQHTWRGDAQYKPKKG
jgi:hypothetical protein